MKAIVTIRLPRNPLHNPKHKREGICPLFCPIDSPKRICTDITGEHHSYIEEGTSLEDIKKRAKVKSHHVTRIEVID